MRIALVCPYELSRPGGVQGQVLGLARALRSLGHESIVVAPDAGPRGWRAGGIFVAGGAVGLRANGSVAPLSLSVRATARAVHAVRNWRADVVHLHEPLAPVLGYGILVSREWPIVATFHRSGTDLASRVAAPAARLAARRIDIRCAVSKAARRTAAAIAGGSYEVLFNGVDLDLFPSAFPVRSEVPAVLFLGRHEKRKGLRVLLEAFALVERDAVLWIANDGPESPALRRSWPASARVHWLGLLQDGEVAARLGGAAVLCAPSLGGESFGMVLLEAMAARCRVVASDIAGYKEAAGGHALLVRPGDPAALARALEAALDERVHAERVLDDRLREAAEYAAGWSLDRLAARYVETYRSAIEARGRSNVTRQ